MNRDLYQAGAALQDYVAQNLTNALAHIVRELATLDGFSGGQDPGMKVTSSSELTTVESQADSRWMMTNAREDLRDAKAQVLHSIRELNDLCNQVLKLRQPKVVVKPEDKLKDCCANGQKGLDGAIEWGDPLCLLSGVKKGMCQAHYMRYYRWSEAHGVDRSGKDFEPA